MEQVKKYICEYDSSLTGTMHYDDFFEFLEDYCRLIQSQHQKIGQIYQKLLSDSVSCV
jgi:hypothetical protein